MQSVAKCNAGIGVFCLLLVLFSYSLVMGQDRFSDDFEDGDIDGWTIVPFVSPDGHIEISTEQAYEGNYSMKMWNSVYPERTTAKRDGLMTNEGIYEAWFYITGFYSDAYMNFQFIDDMNYYNLQLIPTDGDNSDLSLAKRVNGTYTVLADVAPTFSRDEWFKVTIERELAGAIRIYINDELKIDINDTEITEPGVFCVCSWITAYTDNISYTSYISSGVPSITTIGMIVLMILLALSGVTIAYRRARA